MHLTKLKNIVVIVLRDTVVTSEGVNKLTKALPEAEIIYGPSDASIKVSGRWP
jgi:hypothetical protein